MEKLDTKIEYHSRLNDGLWVGDLMRSDVRNRLIDIANFFHDYIGVKSLEVLDIIVTGSMANYNWSKYSDIDLHLIVDFSKHNSKMLEDLVNTKKSLFNKEHDIKIKGHDVELYAQDINMPHHSTGVYSLLKDDWLVKPACNTPEYNKTLVNRKARFLQREINSIGNSCEDLNRLDRIKARIKNMRQCGLDREGEFSVENLVFKILRNSKVIDTLFQKHQEATDRCYGLDEAITENKLEEAPLPDDWDSTIFNPSVPFKTRIAYAKERAKKVGAGSSRVAFEIPYQGRQTVLKVAKNKKGVAQNNVELSVLDDYVVRQYNIFIPLIDADENDTWIHTEFAKPATKYDFVKEFNELSPFDVVRYLSEVARGNYNPEKNSDKFKDINVNSELLNNLKEYVASFGVQAGELVDYNNIDNWGVFEGRLVIIDAGWNKDTARLYRQ